MKTSWFDDSNNGLNVSVPKKLFTTLSLKSLEQYKELGITSLQVLLRRFSRHIYSYQKSCVARRIEENPWIWPRTQRMTMPQTPLNSHGKEAHLRCDLEALNENTTFVPNFQWQGLQFSSLEDFPTVNCYAKYNSENRIFVIHANQINYIELLAHVVILLLFWHMFIDICAMIHN